MKEGIRIENYIGLKLIKAEPCTVEEFNKIRPLVYSGKCQEGYKVEYEDNYISWSPKDVFEKAYRKTDNLTLGLAVEALKKGFKVLRKGWNGKGMYVYYVPANSYKTITEVAKKEFGEMAKYNAYLAIKCVDGSVSTWVPNINDVLAEDWGIVD
jgi:hypothetical protein